MWGMWKSVEHREKDVNTYKKPRGVAMEWSINRNTENERSSHCLMNRHQAQPAWHPAWSARGHQTNRSWGTGAQDEHAEAPAGVIYVKSKGAGNEPGN